MNLVEVEEVVHEIAVAALVPGEVLQALARAQPLPRERERTIGD